MTMALCVCPWGGASRKPLVSSFVPPPHKGQIALLLLNPASESPKWEITLPLASSLPLSIPRHLVRGPPVGGLKGKQSCA